MNSFRFSLQKVLEWRRSQLDLAEVEFRKQAEAVTALELIRTGLRASAAQAEAAVRAAGRDVVDGRELASLGAFRTHIQGKLTALKAERAGAEKRLGELQAAMLESRREFRLLEKLKEKRYAEWQAGLNRELEEMASDSYLAQWNRGRA